MARDIHADEDHHGNSIDNLSTNNVVENDHVVFAENYVDLGHTLNEALEYSTTQNKILQLPPQSKRILEFSSTLTIDSRAYIRGFGGSGDTGGQNTSAIRFTGSGVGIDLQNRCTLEGFQLQIGQTNSNGTIGIRQDPSLMGGALQKVRFSNVMVGNIDTMIGSGTGEGQWDEGWWIKEAWNIVLDHIGAARCADMGIHMGDKPNSSNVQDITLIHPDIITGSDGITTTTGIKAEWGLGGIQIFNSHIEDTIGQGLWLANLHGTRTYGGHIEAGGGYAVRIDNGAEAYNLNLNFINAKSNNVAIKLGTADGPAQAGSIKVGEIQNADNGIDYHNASNVSEYIIQTSSVTNLRSVADATNCCYFDPATPGWSTV